MDDTTKSYRRRSQRDYNLGFKLAVVGQVEKGELTYKQAQKRYGIQGRSTVLVWLRKHGQLNWSTSRGMTMKPSKETPEQKIKRLEKALKEMEDLNYLKDEMLKEVDRHCGTDFRKKYLSSVPDRLKPKAD